MAETCSEQPGVFACSLTGRVRDHNEDAVFARRWPEGEGPLGLTALLVVADGMGGHQRGAWASSTALATLLAGLESAQGSLEDALRAATAEINRIIFESSGNTGSAHPGTTLTLAAIQGAQGLIAHVGDSRAYLLRENQLRQITQDDSWTAELVRQGKMTPQEAAISEHRNQLIKAVGTQATLEPAVLPLALAAKDIILLCSDGLTGMLPDETLLRLLEQSGGLEQAGEYLCQAADNAGGEDNISLALYCSGSWPYTPLAEADKPTGNLAAVTGSPKKSPDRQRKNNAWQIILAIFILLLLLAGLAVFFRPAIFSSPATKKPSSAAPVKKAPAAPVSPPSAPAPKPAQPEPAKGKSLPPREPPSGKKKISKINRPAEKVVSKSAPVTGQAP